MDRTEIGNCIIAGIAESDNCLEQMAEIVTRLELAGWVIVPRKSTPEMNWAGVPDIWDAMISAATARS